MGCVLSGENLTRFVRDEVFPFYAQVSARGAVDFMDGARLVIDEPVVLTQVVDKVDEFIVPEGVLFGSTGAHKELRRMLIEDNRVDAVLSLPGGVFQPYRFLERDT